MRMERVALSSEKGIRVPFHSCPHRPECSKMSLRGDPMVEDSEKRGVKDRRKKPTSRWSWFTFLGRRRIFRRISDQEKAGYVDRYSPILFFLMVLILGLNILDSLFTMMILDLGGQEFNPFVRSFIELHGDMFWVWRFVIVSVALILLYLHRGFIRVRRMIITIGLIYIVIVIYQMYLILYH